MPRLVWARSATPEEINSLKWRLSEAKQKEQKEGTRLFHLGPAPASTRYSCVLLSLEGLTVPEITREVHIGTVAARRWIKRFNESGVAGLADGPQLGRPPTFTPDDIRQIVEVARAGPRAYMLPLGRWSLSTLTEYLSREMGIPISRARLHDILRAENVEWRGPRSGTNRA